MSNEQLATVTVIYPDVGAVRINRTDYLPTMGEIVDAEPPLTDEQLAALYGKIVAGKIDLIDAGAITTTNPAVDTVTQSHPPESSATAAPVLDLPTLTAHDAAVADTPQIAAPAGADARADQGTLTVETGITPAALPVSGSKPAGITKKGKSHIVIDAAGVQIGPKYATEAEAFAAMMGLAGNG